jgi:hypothetical protein
MEHTGETFDMQNTSPSGKAFPVISVRQDIENETGGIMSPKQIIKDKEIMRETQEAPIDNLPKEKRFSLSVAKNKLNRDLDNTLSRSPS